MDDAYRIAECLVCEYFHICCELISQDDLLDTFDGRCANRIKFEHGEYDDLIDRYKGDIS